MPHNERRVVVTGLGAVTPIGNDIPSLWESLKNGKSGAARIARFDPTGYDTTFACEVKNFDVLKFIDRKLSNRMDLFTQFGMAASEMAVADSGMNLDALNKERVGVIYGSGIGGMWANFKQQESVYATGGPHQISPFFVPMIISDICAGYISM